MCCARVRRDAFKRMSRRCRRERPGRSTGSPGRRTGGTRLPVPTARSVYTRPRQRNQPDCTVLPGGLRHPLGSVDHNIRGWKIWERRSPLECNPKLGANPPGIRRPYRKGGMLRFCRPGEDHPWSWKDMQHIHRPGRTGCRAGTPCAPPPVMPVLPPRREGRPERLRPFSPKSSERRKAGRPSKESVPKKYRSWTESRTSGLRLSALQTHGFGRPWCRSP